MRAAEKWQWKIIIFLVALQQFLERELESQSISQTCSKPQPTKPNQTTEYPPSLHSKRLFTVVIRWHFVNSAETPKPEQGHGNRVSGCSSLLKMVPADSGEGQAGPPYLLPAPTKPSCAPRHQCSTLSWTPNSLILIKHATRAIWHLLCLRNIKWKRNIYDQKQPFNSLLLPRFWFFFPFLFANNSASPCLLQYCRKFPERNSNVDRSCAV